MLIICASSTAASTHCCSCRVEDEADSDDADAGAAGGDRFDDGVVMMFQFVVVESLQW